MADLLPESIPEPEDTGRGIASAVAQDAQAVATMNRQRQTALLRGKPRVRRKAVDLSKFTDDMTALIEKKLDNAGGTVKEIAAYIQQRLGTDCSPESYDSPEEKQRLASVWSSEMEVLTGHVKTYLEGGTYGKPIKNSFGQLVGIGDRLSVEKGHYFRNY